MDTNALNLSMDVSSLVTAAQAAKSALSSMSSGLKDIKKVVDQSIVTGEGKDAKYKVVRTIEANVDALHRARITLIKEAGEDDSAFRIVQTKLIANIDNGAKELAAATRRAAKEAEKATRDAAKEATKAAKQTAKDSDVDFLNKRAGDSTFYMAKNLGGIGPQATQQAVINIRNLQNSIEGLIVKGKVSADRMDMLFQGIRTGSVSALGTLTQEEKKAEVALRRLIAAFDGVSNAGKRSQDIMISWRGLIRIFAVQQLHNVIGRITNQLYASTAAGQEYIKAITEIQTISQEANRSTVEWSASLVQLSNTYNLDLAKVTSAAYEALSNQVAEGAEVTYFLADAFEFARSVTATADQAVNLLTATLNAYDQSQIYTTKNAAILFKLIDQGRVRASEINNTFGNTLVLASQLGIGLAEVSAALATLTTQGVRNDSAMTLVNNVILKLLKPTEAMKELLAEWGTPTGEAAIATFGFAGVLGKLNEEFQKGGVSRLAELASDMRAIKGEAGLAGNAFAKFQVNYDAIIGKEAEHKKAIELTADTINYKLSTELNKLNNLFTSDASQRFLKINYDLTKSMGGLAETVGGTVHGLLNLYEISSTIFLGPIAAAQGYAGHLESKVIPAVAATTAAYYIQTRGIVALQAAYVGMASAQAVATLGVSAIVGGLAYIYSSYLDEQRRLTTLAAETTAKLEEENRKIIKNLGDRLVVENDLLEDGFKKQSRLLLQEIAIIRQGMNLKESDIDPEKITKGISKIVDAIKDIGKETDKLKEKLTDLDLEGKLFGKTDRSKSNILKTEIGALVKGGNLEQALKLAEKFTGLQKTKGKFLEGIALQKNITEQMLKQNDLKIVGENKDKAELESKLALVEQFKILNTEAEPEN